MTSIVRISAHPAGNKVVVVKLSSAAYPENPQVNREVTLKSGEVYEVVFYDDVTVSTREVEVTDADAEETPEAPIQ